MMDHDKLNPNNHVTSPQHLVHQTHFPKSCDLEKVFGKKRSHYARTNRDSGNWTKDKMTLEEKLIYKKEMGWKK